MQTIVIRGAEYRFRAYNILEAKKKGIMDSLKHRGTHAPVSEIFGTGEGDLLDREMKRLPDAVLVTVGRGKAVIYRPREALKPVIPE